MAKGLIFVPRVDDRYYTADARLLSGILPWLGPEYVRLYAQVKGGHDVRVIYDDVDPGVDIYSMVAQAPPDTLIGISVTSLSYGAAARIMNIARAREMRVVLGGPHIRSAWRMILERRPYALCVTSSGEEAFLALLNDEPLDKAPGLAFVGPGGIRQNPGANVQYEELPMINTTIDYEPFFKRWDAASGSLYQNGGSRGVSIRGVKGCAKTKQCAFCSVERMESYDPVVRARQIFMERMDAAGRFGESVFIRECSDDLPNTECLEELGRLAQTGHDSPVYVYARIAPVLKKAELVRKAGYTHLLLGLESFSGASYDVMGKPAKSFHQLKALLEKTRSSGMFFYISGILGWPGESVETLEMARRNIEELLKYDHIKGIAIGCLLLYPDTEFYLKLMQEPGMAQKHLGRSEVLDYSELFSDWLARFSDGLKLDAIESILGGICSMDPRINYISGFVR
ncbi:MAG: cobalamin B12-binding domain-containing protein [Nitrospinae bacterium]|nr:cobalamin B12-binding domain-containing protein [Nitrospinota bacterium]